MCEALFLRELSGVGASFPSFYRCGTDRSGASSEVTQLGAVESGSEPGQWTPERASVPLCLFPWSPTLKNYQGREAMSLCLKPRAGPDALPGAVSHFISFHSQQSGGH